MKKQKLKHYISMSLVCLMLSDIGYLPLYALTNSSDDSNEEPTIGSTDSSQHPMDEGTSKEPVQENSSDADNSNTSSSEGTTSSENVENVTEDNTTEKVENNIEEKVEENVEGNVAESTENISNNENTITETIPPITNTLPEESPIADENISPLANLTFSDAKFEAAIRKALNKTSGAITDTDLQSLTSLNISGLGISDISGIRYATNLRELYADNNDIANISELQYLTNLEGLSLAYNNISSITPLSGLRELYFIDLQGNNVSDIAALANLSNLSELFLAENNISTLPSMTNLIGLFYLDLSDNNISDISNLSVLTDLDTLLLDNNNINSINAVSSMTNLYSFSAMGNEIENIAPLQNLSSLRKLFLKENHISDLSVLKNLSITDLSIMGNYFDPTTNMNKLLLDKFKTKFPANNKQYKFVATLTTPEGTDSILNPHEIYVEKFLTDYENFSEKADFDINDFDVTYDNTQIDSVTFDNDRKVIGVDTILPGTHDVTISYKGMDNPAAKITVQIEETHSSIVLFPDANLEQVVRTKINKPTGNIYIKDVANIEMLDGTGRGIADLEGIQHLTSLKTLVMNNNNITSIDKILTLTTLERIEFDDNKIPGKILKDVFSNLTNLTIASFNNNELIGEIPTEIVNLKNLSILRLSNNGLVGSVPVEIGELSKLTMLHLNGNLFTGEIIKEIGELIALTSLDLRDNQFLTIASNLKAEFKTANVIGGNILEGYPDQKQLQLANPITINMGIGETLVVDSLRDKVVLFYNNTSEPISDAYTLQLSPQDTTYFNISFGAIKGGTTNVKIKITEAAAGNTFAATSDNIIVNIEDGVQDNWLNRYVANKLNKDFIHLGDADYKAIKDLTIVNGNLTGQIPRELAKMTNLETIDLSGNTLSGAFPKEIPTLINLKVLNLAGNSFTGKVPTEIGALNSLTVLNLSGNKFIGAVPGEIAVLPALTTLDLRDNQFVSIPIDFPAKYKTDTIIGQNFIEGAVSQKQLMLKEAITMNIKVGDKLLITNLSDKVVVNDIVDSKVEQVYEGYTLSFMPEDTTYFDFNLGATKSGTVGVKIRINESNDGNTYTTTSDTITVNIEGDVEDNWVNRAVADMLGKNYIHLGQEDYDSIEVLSLPNKGLSGLIPDDIGKLRNLVTLNLRNNNLTGTLPTEIKNLTKLQTLDLYGNNITGIPEELGRMKNLRTLNLYDNQVLNMPESVGNLVNLTSLDLGSNELVAIPRTVWNLSELDTLKLDENALTENISPKVGQLQKLRVLKLNDNKLRNEVPSEISTIDTLTDLDISNNQLTELPVNFPARFNVESSIQKNILQGASTQKQLTLKNPSEVIKLNLEDELIIEDLKGRVEIKDGSLRESVNTAYTYELYLDDPSFFDANMRLVKSGTTTVRIKIVETNTANVYGITDTAITLQVKNPVEVEDNWLNRYIADARNKSYVDLVPDDYKAMRVVNVAGRGLSGKIPKDIVKLINLEELNMSNNNFGGNFPEEILSLPKLKILDLSRNKYMGTIPVEIDDLRNLENINLSYNMFIGDVPYQVNNMTSLTTLNFSWNQLLSVPSGFKNDSNFNISYNLIEGRTNQRQLTLKTASTHNIDEGQILNIGALEPLVQIKSGSDIEALSSEYNVELSPNDSSYFDFEFKSLKAGTTTLKIKIVPASSTNTFAKTDNDITVIIAGQVQDNWLNRAIAANVGKSSYTLLNEDDYKKVTSLTVTGDTSITGTIPSEIGKLINATSLNFSGNALTGIPADIGNLRNLESLNISDNKLTSLPDAIGGLSSLTSLNVSTNALMSIPDSLYNLVKLTSLNLSNNKLIGTVAPQISNLTALTEANFSMANNQIIGLPSNIPVTLNTDNTFRLNSIKGRTDSSQKQLILKTTKTFNINTGETLSISNLKDEVEFFNGQTSYVLDDRYTVEIIPEDSSYFDFDLKALKAGTTYVYIKITEADSDNPYTITSNKHTVIIEGEIQDNWLNRAVAENVGKSSYTLLNDDDYKKVTSLTVTNNPAITGTIPSEIGKLINATSLNFSGNGLTGIPADIANLRNLQTLNLSNNKLTSLPDTIGSLSSLTSLDVSNNSLMNIPDSLYNLVKLTTLNLSSNKLIGTIAPQISNLTALNANNFSLANNQIIGIPSSFPTFSNIDTILSKNIIHGRTGQKQLRLKSDTTFDVDLGDIFTVSNLKGEIELFDGTTTYVLDDRYSLELVPNDSSYFDFKMRTIKAGTTTARIKIVEADTNNTLAITSNSYTIKIRNTKANDNWLTREVARQLAHVDSYQYLNDDDYAMITQINMSGQGLTGAIPIEIGKLTNMTTFNVSNNQLSGRITSEIGNARALTKLELQNNRFTSLPDSIGELYKLTYLDVSYNLLTSLPDGIDGMPGLQYLDTSNNNLKALPTTLYNLRNLETMYVDNNDLTGSISPDIGNLIKLKTLTMNDNTLTGTVPSTISNLTELVSLDLTENQLVTIPSNFPAKFANPTSLARNIVGGQTTQKQLTLKKTENWFVDLGEQLDNSNLEDLVELRIDGQLIPLSDDYTIEFVPDEADYFNFEMKPILSGITLVRLKIVEARTGNTWAITDDAITVHIADKSIANNWVNREVARQRGLDLTINNISSVAYINYKDYERVTVINLDNKGINEPIPDDIGKLINIQSLSVAGNSLYGELNYEMGKMTKLQVLNMSQNNLSGSIIENMNKLTALKELNLSSNNLSGIIPNLIGDNLRAITILQLQNNNFHGAIPSNLNNLSSVTYVDLSQNTLYHNIPATIGTLSSRADVRLYDNQLIGPLPSTFPTNYLSTGADKIKGNLIQDAFNQKQLEGKNRVTVNTSVGQYLNIPNMKSLVQLTWNGNKESLHDVYDLEVAPTKSHYFDVNGRAAKTGNTTVRLKIVE